MQLILDGINNFTGRCNAFLFSNLWILFLGIALFAVGYFLRWVIKKHAARRNRKFNVVDTNRWFKWEEYEEWMHEKKK